MKWKAHEDDSYGRLYLIGNKLFTCSDDKTIKIWKIANIKEEILQQQ